MTTFRVALVSRAHTNASAKDHACLALVPEQLAAAVLADVFGVRSDA
jgi:hypothetical protein